MHTTTSTLYRNDQFETMRAICPYCGHDNVPAIDLDARHATILCEEETGGCDRYFWIRIQRQALVESYAIEGQHPEISPTTLTMVNSQPAGLSDRVNMNGTGHHSPVTEVTQPPQADTTPAQPCTPEEPQENADQAAIDWVAKAEELIGPAAADALEQLAAGEITWRRIDKELQRNILLMVIATLQTELGKCSGGDYDEHRPTGMPKFTAFLKMHKWSEWKDLATAWDKATPQTKEDAPATPARATF